MPASNFADLIISKLKSSIGTDGSKFSSSTPAQANSAIAQAITEYLTSNTLVPVTYVGMIPGTPPVPDPIVADVCKITGTCSPPTGTTFDVWVKSLETNIVAGFFISNGTAGVMPITPPPAFLPGLVLSQATIKSIHTANLKDPQKPVWQVITQSILTWLNAVITPPYAATTGKSTGTATPTKTTVT